MKTAQQLVQEAKKNITEVSLDNAQQTCQQADIVLDVREPDEYRSGHIPNAVSMPRGVVEFKIDQCTEDKKQETQIVVYCKTGGRAALACQALQDMGYQNVQSITGGYEAWKAADLPIEKKYDDVNFY